MASQEELYVEAFADLGTCRPIGMEALGPIPWTAVKQYADHLGLDDEARTIFMGAIRALDGEWMAFQEEERKKQRSLATTPDNEDDEPPRRRRLKGM